MLDRRRAERLIPLLLALPLVAMLLLRDAGPDPAALRAEWGEDVARAVEEAGRSGKLVLVGFRAESCGWCVLMDREMESPVAAKALRGFVVARVDVPSTVSDRHGVGGVPAFLVLDARGRELGRIRGWRPAEDFAEALSRIAG